MSPDIALAILWFLGRGEKDRVSPRPRPERPELEIEPPEDIPHINAWPRAVPKGGERGIKLTGGANPIAWRQSRYAAAKAFLSTDDRSIEAMTRLVEQSIVEHGNFAIDDIALSVVTHWDIETASGQHEYNFNVGGIAALPSQAYFLSMDVASNPPRKQAFCAYDDLTQGIADYFGVLSYQRYQNALVWLLMSPTLPDWFRELGYAGYFGMDPEAAANAFSARRAMVSVDVR